MNSNDKANYYDNLNNSTIKASKRLTNTAINQMPVEANFIPSEAPEDFDGIFDKAVDLYNSLIIHSKEIYQYFNESSEFYPKSSKESINRKVKDFKLSGSGRRQIIATRARKHRLKGGFNRILNAEKTPRYTEYVMGKQYPLRSNLFGGMLHGGVDTPPESESESESDVEQEPQASGFVAPFGFSVFKATNMRDILNKYYSINHMQVPRNFSRASTEALKKIIVNIPIDWTQPPYNIQLTQNQLKAIGVKTPKKQSAQPALGLPEPLPVQEIDDGQPPEPDPNAPLDIGNVAIAKNYNFELNPILGIVNKMLLTIKNLYKYEKYLLKNYEYIKPEDGETLKDIYNELCQNFVYILHIVEYFEEHNATMDTELNYKTIDALKQLLTSYKQVITNLVNILEAKNFNIEIVPEIENYQPVGNALNGDVYNPESGSENSDDDDDFNQLLRNLDIDIEDDVNRREARRIDEQLSVEAEKEAENENIRRVIMGLQSSVDNPVYKFIENEGDEMLRRDIDTENETLKKVLQRKFREYEEQNYSNNDIIQDIRHIEKVYNENIDKIVQEYLERNQYNEALQQDLQRKDVGEPEYRERIEAIIKYMVDRKENPLYNFFPPEEVDDIFRSDIDNLNKEMTEIIEDQLKIFKEKNYSNKKASEELLELKKEYDKLATDIVKEYDTRKLYNKDIEEAIDDEIEEPELPENSGEIKTIVESIVENLLDSFEQLERDPPKPEGISKTQQMKINDLTKEAFEEAKIIVNVGDSINTPEGEIIKELNDLYNKLDADLKRIILPTEDLSKSMIDLIQGLPSVPPATKKSGPSVPPATKKSGRTVTTTQKQNPQRKKLTGKGISEGAMHHIEKQMEYQKQYPNKGMLYQHRNPAYRRDNILELINKYPIDQLNNLTKYLL